VIVGGDCPFPRGVAEDGIDGDAGDRRAVVVADGAGDGCTAMDSCRDDGGSVCGNGDGGEELNDALTGFLSGMAYFIVRELILRGEIARISNAEVVGSGRDGME
jgi:hypothetical protein